MHKNLGKKTFGALVRQLRLSRGDSLRDFAKEIGTSANFLSGMETGKFAPAGEEKIKKIAEILGQDKDEMLALAGKVSSDIIEIIQQNPKEISALLRRLNHASPTRIKNYTTELISPDSIEFYPLDTISRENHTAVIGESGSGKSLLTKYLIQFYFEDADIGVYDSDAAPRDWGNMEVIGKKGNYKAIAAGMIKDMKELKKRTELHGDGKEFSGEIVRVIEEYPSTAAELSEQAEIIGSSKDIGLLWLKRLLRRGRKYRMKVFAVAQEFEVNAWKISGEGGLRRAFTVLYLGSTAYRALTLVKDKKYREQLRLLFDGTSHPCLVDVKGRYYPAQIPDLSPFEEERKSTVSTIPNLEIAN